MTFLVGRGNQSGGTLLNVVTMLGLVYLSLCPAGTKTFPFFVIIT